MGVLDWIYPPRCMVCRGLLPLNEPQQRQRWLCAACDDFIVPLPPPLCARCGHPLLEENTDGNPPDCLSPHAPNGSPPRRVCAFCRNKSFHFAYNRSVYAYTDVVRELIHKIKFQQKKHIAEGLALCMAQVCASESFYSEHFQRYDTLVPVPMYLKKQRKRGFNQAAIIAEALSKHLHLPLLNKTLMRVRDTTPQSALHFRARAFNVANVFAVTPHSDLKNKNICLVDDIFTTGATLNECAKVLLANGAERVSCMTLSIAVKNIEKD